MKLAPKMVVGSSKTDGEFFEIPVALNQMVNLDCTESVTLKTVT